MKVLVADDEPVARTLFSHWLTAWGYEVVAVSDGRAALEALESDPSLRIALLDWMMPESSGPEIVRQLRERAGDHYVYVMLVTARHDKADVIEGLESGADDYIAKPCNPLELKVRVRAGHRVVELQQELVRAREALRFEAMHDPLTGLLNRRAVIRMLEQELTRAGRTGSPISVALIDLDRFKSINDTHGHAIGDAVLVSTARSLEQAVRGYDHVGRLGGEELVVVLPDCTEDDAVNVAERLRMLLRLSPVSTPAGLVSFTASFGVASSEHVGGGDPHALVDAADAALYRAKNKGRDRVERASTSTLSVQVQCRA